MSYTKIPLNKSEAKVFQKQVLPACPGDVIWNQSQCSRDRAKEHCIKLSHIHKTSKKYNLDIYPSDKNDLK